MKVNHKIIYPIINGEISGGNIVCLNLIDEALSRGWEVLVNSPTDGAFCDILRERGVSIYHINTNRSFRLDAAIKIAEIIKSQQVSLVHSHAPFAGTTIACLAGKIANVPVIVHAHWRDPLSANSLIKVYQRGMNYLTSRLCCAAIISVSKQIKKELIAEGLEPKKIQVVYNGTILNTQLPDSELIRKNLNIPDNIPVVVHVGRLCKNKGQYVLLNAASNLRQNGQEIIYLIIGEDLEQHGAYLQYLKHLAQEFKIDDIVQFLGQRLDVPQLLAIADLLVLPSFTEGLPLVILEAMAAGKPVVTTPVGGVPEAVSHKETGLLVPVDDVSALSEAILWIVENPEPARVMGSKGLEIVKANFSVEKMQQGVFHIYEQILGNIAGLKGKGEGEKG